MSRDDIHKLLGGYATDTLSDAERQALYEAALEDQELFDTLAKEEALRDVLQDPAARQQLIQALGPARESFGARAWLWLRRPMVLATAGGLAAVIIGAGLALWQERRAARPTMVADAIAPQPLRAFQSPPAKPQAQHAARLPQPPALVSRNEPIAPPPLSAEANTAPAPPPPAAAPSPAVALAVSGRAVAEQPAGQKLETIRQQATGSFLAVPNASPPPGMRLAKAAAKDASAARVTYSLLLKGADGLYSAAPAGNVFHAGDSVRLQVESKETGHIQLLQKSGTGAWNEVASVNAENGRTYAIPAEGGIESAAPAQMQLRLVFSRREEAKFKAVGRDAASLVAVPGVEEITLEFR